MNPAIAFFLGSAFTACLLLLWAVSRRDVDHEAGVRLGNEGDEP